MSRLRSLSCAALVAGAALCAVAASGLARAADNPAIPARQANYKQLGGAFGGINAELRKDMPDLALVRANAAKMHDLAAQLPSWFPVGSGPETGMKTGAKAEIWSDPQGFAAAAKGLLDETARLQQVAAGGDVDALKAQVRATGGACKGCHDKYRAQEVR